MKQNESRLPDAEEGRMQQSRFRDTQTEAVRIDIRAYTASFRVPGMMGYQITSPVPPPSTVYGLMSAAAGRDVTPEETWIAYRFDSQTLVEDLEKLIAFGPGGPWWESKINGINTAPITRQFLFDAHLVLYLRPGPVAESFLRPCYPLLLGRSQDLAYVSTYTPISLHPVDQGVVSGVLLPFPIRDPRLRSQILSFPTYFPLGPLRRPAAVRPFHVVRELQLVTAPDLLYEEVGTLDSLAVPLMDGRLLGTRPDL